MSAVEHPTVGLALIARDEQHNLPRLLASVEGAFDEVALVDTGSKDRTVELFEEWASGQVAAGQLRAYRVDHMDWADDFSAARNRADSLLDTDWTSWADCDDEVRGADRLREIAAQAPADAVGLVVSYDYAQDPHGNCICRLKRERLVRKGAGRWVGRVHEAQLLDGALAGIPRDQVEWVHRKAEHGSSSARNRRILRRWVRDEPDNPRVLRDLASEELGRGKPKLALRYARRYLALAGTVDEERAWVARKACLAHMALGDHPSAIRLALDQVAQTPGWPDSYLTLAEAHYYLEEPAKAAHWARQTLLIGEPDTMLIVDPTDYTVLPRAVLAGALGQLGEPAQALEACEQALHVQPDHQLLVALRRKLRSDRKRDATARTFVSAAQVLVAHDEQLKARRLLDQVPYFAYDHPEVVAMRSHVRERVDPLLDPAGYQEHYETGGSKPEDMVDDPLQVGDQLPRCHFLLRGLDEQAREAAA